MPPSPTRGWQVCISHGVSVASGSVRRLWLPWAPGDKALPSVMSALGPDLGWVV
jgi:hypothetical protein